MAEVKKKVEKKDDKKKPEAPAPKTGNDYLWELVGFFAAIVILASALFNFSVLDYLSSNSNNNQDQNQIVSGDYSFWGNLINKIDTKSFPSSGKISFGSEAVNKGLTQVRREPAGSVIGLQKRGEIAKIIDGPTLAYGDRWWMVDYENPPSGWVDEKDITTEYFLFYVVNFFPTLWDYLKIISWIVSIFFVLAIIYYLIREHGVPLYDEQAQTEDINEDLIISDNTLTTTQAPPANLPTGEYVVTPQENTRWDHVQLLLKSHNSSDWRQAIIEADVMLDDMLDKMGYPGVSIGDKLKNIEESDFETLDKAWEAHKVRNRIAHDGSEYKLPYNEVARVIGLYHEVFKEFYWI